MQAWPNAARDEVLAVAHRDLAADRRNVAACAGALGDTVPLMSAEKFPRMPGGIRSALQEARRDQ